jgi:hypothetical protein
MISNIYFKFNSILILAKSHYKLKETEIVITNKTLCTSNYTVSHLCVIKLADHREEGFDR